MAYYMYNIRMHRHIGMILAALILQGCGTLPSACGRDHRDRPWDPCPGQALFDQIPNWDPNADILDLQGGPAAGDIVIRR
jgi:hypothetical protein